MGGDTMSPVLIEHCNLTFSRYGVYGRDIHIWMDEPIKLYGPNHRHVRHDPNQQIPIEFILKYGLELARNIMLDHLLEDAKTPNGIKNYEDIDEINIKKFDEVGFQKFMKYMEEEVKKHPSIPNPKGFDKFIEYMEKEVEKRERKEFNKIEYIEPKEPTKEFIRLTSVLTVLENRLSKIENRVKQKEKTDKPIDIIIQEKEERAKNLEKEIIEENKKYNALISEVRSLKDKILNENMGRS